MRHTLRESTNKQEKEEKERDKKGRELSAPELHGAKRLRRSWGTNLINFFPPYAFPPGNYVIPGLRLIKATVNSVSTMDSY